MSRLAEAAQRCAGRATTAAASCAERSAVRWLAPDAIADELAAEDRDRADVELEVGEARGDRGPELDRAGRTPDRRHDRPDDVRDRVAAPADRLQ